MKIIDLQQGTPEWRAHRAKLHNASEAPAMMGASTAVKRSDLVRMKATGTEQQFSSWVEEVLFERGHEIEAAARPLAEKHIGEELYPATGQSDEFPDLGASFDGITMDEATAWECKQWNEAKAALVREGIVPPEDRWQCVQQLVVSGAKRLVYTLSDGTPDRTLHCDMTLTAEAYKALINGWKQFDADVAAYQPEPVAEAVVGRAPAALPALLIQVTGAVTQSNLPEYKARALEVFRSIKTDLATDADFADAELAIKFCEDIEDKIESAKQHALGQTVSIAELFRSFDEISAEARDKRLALDKLVKSRKDTIRLEAIRGGELALRVHVETINKRLGKVSLPAIPANFAGAIKGLKTLASVKDAIATELARAKIDASAWGEKIDANLQALREHAAGYETLFADAQQLVLKDTADLVNLVRARIAEHLAEQRRREEASQPPPAPQPSVVVPIASTPAPKPRLRADGPTREQVVSLVASHYRVAESVARGWLARMHFNQTEVA